jgi:hypothetical protein
MDWFERITGFRETGYEAARGRLQVEGALLRSLVNGKTYSIGRLEVVSLQTLRERAQSGVALPGQLKVDVVRGDVRRLHQALENAGALFQVASQFNMLEMISPDVTPEQGVTRYQNDMTQGPACAIAAGAATIYRNYFVPVGNRCGQTAEHQLDGLAQMGDALATSTGQPVAALWDMQNGYALCSKAGLRAISKYIEALTPDAIDALAGTLCVGLHQDVEVTDAEGPNRPIVSQIFCSALPVLYSDVPANEWKAFASLILQAAYEATLWACVVNAQRGASNVVLLTRLGGGAFGNDDEWIDTAMRRAFRVVADFGLNVKIVSYDVPSVAMLQLARIFQ